MKVIPLFDTLHVTVPDEKKETDGGIVIPDTHSADRPQRGTVAAIGDDVKKVKVGDMVIFRKYSPDVIELNGEKVYLLSEKEDVKAIIEE